MAKQSSENRKKQADPSAMPPRVVNTVNAYLSGADVLGSYTGVVDKPLRMPRKVADGKIYLKVEETPVQDADDL